MRFELAAAPIPPRCRFPSPPRAICWALLAAAPLHAQEALRDVVDVTAGSEHACALLRDHTVVCWGANTNGQLGDGTTTDRSSPVAVRGLAGRPIEVRAGSSQTCALLEGGSVQGTRAVPSSRTARCGAGARTDAARWGEGAPPSPRHACRGSAR
jgi:alpha-tubulin suppressor-like RCC1 family protein